MKLLQSLLFILIISLSLNATKISQEDFSSKKEKLLKELEQKIDKKTREFKLLKIKVAEQNKLLTIHEETIDNQREFIWLSVSALILFLFIMLVISYLLKRQRATNKLLQIAKKELKVAKNKAVNANYNKSNFIASMSHELRTPLNAVLGYSQLLQKDKSFSQKHQKTFATIRNSGEHLLALINDILLISKMEAGHIEVNNKNANTYELFDSIYSMFLLKVEKKNIYLKLEITKEMPKYIITDVDKLRQILINLLNNAVKFTHKGGIKLVVNCTNDTILITVEDTGDGVAKDEIDKLFKKYEQTQSGIDDGGGTGLGLTLVKKFTDILDGTIKVHSTLGEGSIFKVSIPYKISENIIEVEKFPDVIRLAANQKDFKILIVDDIKISRELLKDILESVGFITVQAINGQDAIKMFKQEKPDIILMDYRMPIMDGKETTKNILEMDNTLPIIAVTASIVDMERLIENPDPFIAAISKPFNENELLYLISKYIDIVYLYEEEESNIIKEIDLQKIPSKEKEELLKATKSMSITSVNKIIESLNDTYRDEKEYMQNLVSDFNFSKLEEILNKN